MKFYGVKIAEGANVANLVVETGGVFPFGPDNPPDKGEMFYKTGSGEGLYVYDGTSWEVIGERALGPELQALESVTSAADTIPYFTGSGTAAVTSFTSFARQLVDDTDQTEARATLGLGTAATANIGTFGGSVPLLNGANTWSANQTFSGSINYGGITQASIQPSTINGRFARWNSSNSRYESFDLFGSANTWSVMQIFGGASGTEGGEIALQAPIIGTNLSGTVNIDVQTNTFRVFGTFNGQTRGFLYDFGSGTDGSINNIWHTGTLGITVNGGNSNSYDQSSPLLLRQWNASSNSPEAFTEIIHFPGAGAAHALQIGYWGGDAQRYYIRHYNDQNGWGGGSATWRQLWHSGNLTSTSHSWTALQSFAGINVTSGLIQRSVSSGLAATGSNQSTALQLSSAINVISSAPAGTGVMLPLAIGASCVVINASANVLNVYPVLGARIDSGGVNVPFTMPAGSRLEFIQTSATQYYTLNATYA